MNPSLFQSISIDVDVAGGDGDDANVGTNVDNILKSFPTIGGISNLPVRVMPWLREEIYVKSRGLSRAG